MSRPVSTRLALATAPEQAARRHGDTAITLDRPLALFPDTGTDLTYRVFADLVTRAAGLLAGAGVVAGQRVMVLKGEGLDTPMLAFACARLGAVPVLVHPTVPPEAVAVMVRRAEPALVVTDAAVETAGVLDGVPESTPPRVYVGMAGRFGPALADHEPGAVPPATVPPADSPQLVTHSSGTTAVPKLALHTVRSFAGHARPQVFLGRVLRVRDPYLMCLSCVHARTMSGLLALLALGLPFGLVVDPDPRSVLPMLRKVRPGVVETVPNVFIRWEELAELGPDCLSQVRMFLASFDAIHPRTVAAMLGMARRRARFLQTYGQTETGPITVRVHRLGRRGDHGGRCVGRPVIGHTRIRVETQDGRRAGRNASGSVLAWSSGVMPTYLGTENVSTDRWWPMGDHGAITGRGCLHLYDRLVDQVPGVQSLLAVEDTILDRLPALTEVALIRMPDGPPVPLVCTRGDTPLDPASWRQATEGLPGLAEPFQCRWEDIPHTATWKVRRSEVARRLAANALPVIVTRP